jgi:putative transposase
LAVKNLRQNHQVAKAIADVGWGELIRQLEYKAAWYGHTLVAIDRFFPSSKRCSACEYLLDDLDLDVRQWTCPNCGTVHDRDTNAASNGKAEGLSVLACGGAVSPNLNGNQGGHAPVKQERPCREAGNPIIFR